MQTQKAKDYQIIHRQKDNPLRLFLYAQNCVFGCLGDAEFHHSFGCNLNGFPSGRISTHASFTMDQNQLAQSRYREAVLGVLVCQDHQSFQDLHTLLFSQAHGFRK